MLTLATADTIAGVAQSAATVTFTLFGMELNGATETYKVLFQGQLPAAAATQYTAPASNIALIRKMVLVNTSASLTQTFQLFRGGTAQANAITPVLTLPPSGMAIYVDGEGWKVFDSAGNLMTRVGNGLAAAFLSASTANQTSTTEAVVSPVLTIPANYLKAGAIIEFELAFSGAQGAVAQTTPGHIFQLRHGGLAGTIVGSIGTITPATVLAATSGYVQGMLSILTIGATGTCRSQMSVTDPRGTRVAAGDMPTKTNNTGSTTIDTTTAKDIVITHKTTVADAAAITFGFAGWTAITINN